MIGRETRERILQTCKVHGSDSDINIAAFHLLCDGLVELGRAEGRSEARLPLTDKEILTYRYMIDWTAEWSYINFARAIEAAHGIKEPA